MRNKPRWLGCVLTGVCLGLLTACPDLYGQEAPRQAQINTPLFTISWAAVSVDSWQYALPAGGDTVDMRLPEVELDGTRIPLVLHRLEASGAPVPLRNGAEEYAFAGALETDASICLRVKFRVAPDNPVVRFCYTLETAHGQRLTKRSGSDALVYLSYSLKEYPVRKEIRLSVFNEMIHSCNLSEVSLNPSDFEHSMSFAGPILAGTNDHGAFLCAYEHDALYPDHFLEFRLQPDERVTVCAVKGNYCAGQPVQGFSSIWFEVAAMAGGEDALAEHYRTFARKYLSENSASRKPYLYYNTWGRQERVKWQGGRYLDTMNLDYTLREIDRAHEMGVEVYVLDAGWFDKTGDWGVNLKNFPDGFSQVRARLEQAGMQLGVWMNPAKAAVSSRALRENEPCLKTSHGKAGAPAPEWETEDSTDMCLVSPYWDYYADTLIRLYNELGIRYFYLDGVGQTGCDDPRHFHGAMENSAEERQECYGFLLPVYLGKIIAKVGAACPDVIFDFDVTESRRIGVGLQFLASGRYFILNNGPYFHNFDLCSRGESILPNGCHNIFIHPGPARTWFMRSVLDYDRWIPSNLFMANYMTDDPKNSQIINLASLVLGQNAIWGDILHTSPEGAALFHDILAKYKHVREDVAAASPIRIGHPGDTPEMHEKINPETGNGVLVIFANAKGAFSYTTRHAVAGKVWHNEGVEVNTTLDNHAAIHAKFDAPSAKIIFFGVE